MARPSKIKMRNATPGRAVPPESLVREKDIEAASALTQTRRRTAKQTYLEMGPGRSLVKAEPLIIKAIGDVSRRTIEKWSSEDEWVEAGVKYDTEIAERETQSIRELIELGKLDHSSALHLVMAKGLDLLLKSKFAITSPQDARAVMAFIKQAQDVIEIKADPEGSEQQGVQHGKGSEAEVRVTLRGSRAIAALSGIEHAMQERVVVRPAVIDVTPERVKEEVEPVKDNVSRETPAAASPAPALPPPAVKPFAMDVHELAKIATKEGKTFSQILDERKPKN